jgi:ATP-dependent Lhr-like helicase
MIKPQIAGAKSDGFRNPLGDQPQPDSRQPRQRNGCPVMRIESLCLDVVLAYQPESASISVSRGMFLCGLFSRCRRGKDPNLPVSEHTVDIEQKDLDSPRPVFGHGRNFSIRSYAVRWSRLLRFQGEQFAKPCFLSKIKLMSSLPAAQIPTSLEWAHPLVQEWFVRRFGTPTEPQEQGWPHILAGRTTLISAPTGSGKTLAAFLACIDQLVRKALAGDLHDRTEVLYVSPLKALGNDIQKNLEVPLGEILQMAGERGLLMPPIRSAVRTGDTLMHERRAMLKHPPHILVTTPESLYILLTAEKSRAVLRDVETVIVDEIHAVADDKRGAHLTLSLERLEALTHRRPVRIGLSATQKPIEEVAHFLTGAGRPNPVVVDIGHKRQLDLAVEIPASELGPVASNEMWDEIYERISELVRQHRSTLVFVNTRRLAERVAHNLAERLGDDAVAAHHGSLSRKLRLAAEKKLKNGEIQVLVATASLELGIDIGTVDLVCQMSSTRAIAVALQRVGRSGHWRGAIPKGRIFAMTRDELVETAALVRSIRHGELDRLIIPDCPLDILGQQIVATCASDENGWRADDLFALVRGAHPYRNLSRETFNGLINMLSDGIASRRGRYGAYLHHDQVNGHLRARRGSRLAAITSGGAIPETALFTVVAEPEGTMVGTLDEDFAVESLAGDVVLLGNTSWRIRRIEGRTGRVIVEDAHGAAPGVPFWLGEAPARTAELSAQVADLRQEISERLPNVSPVGLSPTQPVVAETVSWLKEECGLEDAAAEQMIEYVLQGRAVLGAVPTQDTVIAERFFDEAGGMQLIIHAPFGGRINKAWGLALRKRFCRSFNFELQAAATDNGLNIALAEQHSFPLAEVFQFLQPETVQPILQQAALASPIFGTRWRWDATRSLALLRFQGGKKVPPQIQRMRSDDLLASVFPDVAACQENIQGDIQIPDHPLVNEVMKDVLTEAMDVDGLKDVLQKIGDGRIRCIAVDTPVPSQFSHEILNANPYAYLDDAPLEERRARAVEMRRILPESVLQEVGKLDPNAIAQVREEAWPDVRDPDELHDVLMTLVAFPEHAVTQVAPAAQALALWQGHLEKLIADGRAAVALVKINNGGPENARRYWVAAEPVKRFTTLFPDAELENPVCDLGDSTLPPDEVLLAAITGWMTHIGPTTAAQLGDILGLPAAEIDKTLLRLEATGSILRGKFTDPAMAETEWCERRLLARIHRLTLGSLRKQIEPVTAAQFMRWLLRWQHVSPGTEVLGERGTLDILRQLQGFEIPANAWERQILARRIADYDPKILDQLCMTGAVGWGRLSPHPATLEETAQGKRRVIPTSVAPVTFFVREESDWMTPRHPGTDLPGEARGLSEGAKQVLNFLRHRGASFFADIVRATDKLKSEIETALWELVAAGIVTADGFDNLRSLIDPKRRAGQGHGRSSRPRHNAGRWSLLYTDAASDRNKSLEATCWMLLKRYGVVFRDLLVRETILPKWRELQVTFRRLEDRGEIRGGRFVDGFTGEQFALPIAVDSLRATKKIQPSGEVLTLSAADPLNLIGILVPGERVPAISGRTITFRDGVAVANEESFRAAGD